MRVSTTLCLLIGLSLLLTAPARAAVVYVNKNAPGTVHDGKSWGTAFTTVQVAVESAVDGDEVWVAAATYGENITVSKGLALYGGFAGTETARIQRDWKVNATVLDGNRTGSALTFGFVLSPCFVDGFTIQNGRDSSGYGGIYAQVSVLSIAHCTITGNEGSGAYIGGGGQTTLTGDTITGNVGDGVNLNSGGTLMECTISNNGGAGITGSDCTLTGNTITGNVRDGVNLSPGGKLTGNSITGNGGAGVSLGFGGTLTGNTISNNHGDGFNGRSASLSGNIIVNNGGNGAYFTSGDAVLTNTTVSGNGLEGIYAPFGGLTVTACTISGNHSGGVNSWTRGLSTPALVTNSAICGNLGVGIEFGEGHGAVDNSVVAGNTGVGISAGTNAVVSIRNTISAFNGDVGVETAPYGGFALEAGVISVFSHNDVYGNVKGAYTRFTPPAGMGDITLDPLFKDRTNGDYHLTAGSPCIDAGDDSVVTPGQTDLVGLPRIRGPHVDIGAYEAPVPPAIVSIGDSLAASPVTVEGIVYASGENGKLYAYTSGNLAPVAGFPVDISAAVGVSVKLIARSAVYYGKAGKAIYLITSLGQVVKVWPDGRIGWAVEPADGAAMSTPAVTPDGHVYVNLGKGTASIASHLIDLDETTGVTKLVSPVLGSSPPNALFDRSAAVNQSFAYVNTSGDSLGSLAVLNRTDLTVRASFAPGEDALAPFLDGRNIYVATKTGSVYKVNGITMSPDLAFGTLGAVKMGEAVTAGPFLDTTGTVYVGTGSGKVWKLDGATGTKSLFLDSGTSSAITGLLVTHSTIAFATASGTLQQVPLGNPSGKSVETLSGPPAGGPVYDAVQNRFIIATTSGQVYSVPGM